MYTLVVADSRIVVNGPAYRFDRRPDNRKRLDKETRLIGNNQTRVLLATIGTNP